MCRSSYESLRNTLAVSGVAALSAAVLKVARLSAAMAIMAMAFYFSNVAMARLAAMKAAMANG